jgi:hypothetical protein
MAPRGQLGLVADVVLAAGADARIEAAVLVRQRDGLPA